MYILITILLSIWTLYVGHDVSGGTFDLIILMCWITWPLYLVCIFIFARQRGHGTKFWKLKAFGDYLLTGAFVPLVLGIAYFNFALPRNLQNAEFTLGQNLLFVGYYSVLLWGMTAVSVFLFYISYKITHRKKSAVKRQNG